MIDRDSQERTLSGTPIYTSDQETPAAKTPPGAEQPTRQHPNRTGLEDLDIQATSGNEAGQGMSAAGGATDSPLIQIGSTTLSRLPSSKKPLPSTVCESCPAVVWYARKEKVQAYCRLIHLISWETGQVDPITVCDGPAIASQ